MEIVAGIGIGLVFQPPLIALLSLVESDDVATAVVSLDSSAASLHRYQSSLTASSFRMGCKHYNQFPSFLPASLAQMFLGDMAAANVNAIVTLTQAQKILIKASYTQSLSMMWILYTSTAGVALLLSFLISKRTLSREHTEIKTHLKDSSQGGLTVNETSTSTAQLA